MEQTETEKDKNYWNNELATEAAFVTLVDVESLDNESHDRLPQSSFADKVLRGQGLVCSFGLFCVEIFSFIFDQRVVLI